jgi:hypothetical protein
MPLTKNFVCLCELLGHLGVHVFLRYLSISFLFTGLSVHLFTDLQILVEVVSRFDCCAPALLPFAIHVISSVCTEKNFTWQVQIGLGTQRE